MPIAIAGGHMSVIPPEPKTVVSQHLSRGSTSGSTQASPATGAHLLAEAGIDDVATPGGQNAPAKGPVPHRLYVDSMQFHRAEDVLMRFLHDHRHGQMIALLLRV
jgi:hypothetical protein